MKTRPKEHAEEHTKQLTTLEKRRLKAAKSTILFALVLLFALAISNYVESLQAQTDTLSTIEALDLEGIEGETLSEAEQEELSSAQNKDKPEDPFSIDQEGIEFIQSGSEGTILWYQSSWDVAQSRALLERELALKGWQSLSNEQEQPMSFVYAPSATAAGGSLFAMLYPTEQGCSIVLELI